MRTAAAVIAVCFVLATGTLSAGTLTVTPTTTLAAESGNNTSAASTFTTLSDGNIGATNVSKVASLSLFYSGANVPVYAHFMPWFGGTNHMNVGYASNDPAQVHRQVDDMMSRGIAGAIIDWYGPSFSREDQTTQYMRTEAETRGGQFVFAVMEDAGALKKCSTTTGCSITQQLISDLTYAYNQYEVSPAYMFVNGRPVVFTFGLEAYTIDWTTVVASIPGNPAIIFRNAGGFTHAATSGSFSWVNINASNANDIGLSYLDNFYSTGKQYPAEQTYGTAYKGFNDSQAAWHPSPSRLMNQNCGQTWLQSASEAGKYYNSSSQLPFIQLVTWNDYDEGTEMETGIDNCVSISASASGTKLAWSIAGNENTLDHYTVFVSIDGQNLMQVADVPAGTHGFDLSAPGLMPGDYIAYVKAVGKPSVVNHVSAAVKFSIADVAPTAQLTVTPTSGAAALAVTASTAGSTSADGSVPTSSIDFGDGSVATGPSAAHTYSTPGAYAVTATVTDTFGLTGTATASVNVSDVAPTAQLTLSTTSGIAPVSVTASTSGSTSTTGTISGSTIDFGDGTAVSGPTAAHTYATAGTYTVTATVTDNFGTSSSTTQTVTVKQSQPPVAALSVTPTSGTAPVTVSASTAASTAPNGSVASSSINFGDGTTAAGPTASHIYSKPGQYTVTATVTDNTGVSATATATVNVGNVAPTAALTVTPSAGVAPANVTASTSGSTSSTGTIASSAINFGDGTTASGPTATHNYSNAGTYTVTATVTDSYGTSSTATQTVTIAAAGVALVSPANGGSYNSNVHVAASAQSGSGITALAIYVDNTLALKVNAASVDTYIAMATGSHYVVAQAWDSAGAIYKSPATINVTNALPTAALSVTPTSGTAPVTVTATTSASTDADGTIASSTINFGDGTVASGPTAQHSYSAAGTYTVTATVTDNVGGSSTAAQTVVVSAATKSAGVIIQSPNNGSTSGSPVHFVAKASSTNGRITAMRIYVDDVSVYLVNAGSLNTYVSMAKGQHYCVVQAWDSTGAVYKAAVTVSVQ